MPDLPGGQDTVGIQGPLQGFLHLPFHRPVDVRDFIHEGGIDPVDRISVPAEFLE